LNSNGEAVIVWTQADDTESHILRSEYRNGLWKDPVNASDDINPNTTEAFQPQVALNDNGEAVIVWTQTDGANYQIFRSEYRNGAWTEPTGPTDNISPNGLDATDPQVALNNNGDTVIVWSQFDGLKKQIFRSEYRNGSWKDPVGSSDNISPDGQDAVIPRVDLNDQGEAVIVWSQSNGTHNQIFRSEYRNGSWKDPAGISDNISPDGQSTAIPQVDLNNQGEAVIVWEQSDGMNSRVFLSEYQFGF
jgi:uncharacterized protein YheU (UPF0270 family)